MQKMYCDICGREITSKYDTSVPLTCPPPKGEPIKGVIDIAGSYGGTYHYDLCDKCSTLIFKYMKQLKLYFGEGNDV